jgi:hypothetical protein
MALAFLFLKCTPGLPLAPSSLASCELRVQRPCTTCVLSHPLFCSRYGCLLRTAVPCLRVCRDPAFGARALPAMSALLGTPDVVPSMRPLAFRLTALNRPQVLYIPVHNPSEYPLVVRAAVVCFSFLSRPRWGRASAVLPCDAQ